MPDEPPPLTREERLKHLTPQLRQWFDGIGEELVRHDVSYHNYSVPEKHHAGVAWLGESGRIWIYGTSGCPNDERLACAVVAAGASR